MSSLFHFSSFLPPPTSSPCSRHVLRPPLVLHRRVPRPRIRRTRHRLPAPAASAAVSCPRPPRKAQEARRCPRPPPPLAHNLFYIPLTRRAQGRRTQYGSRAGPSSRRRRRSCAVRAPLYALPPPRGALRLLALPRVQRRVQLHVLGGARVRSHPALADRVHLLLLLRGLLFLLLARRTGRDGGRAPLERRHLRFGPRARRLPSARVRC
ncbi:hypothetical protein C8R46DRAFT_1121502, partial [Mycena filopes]